MDWQDLAAMSAVLSICIGGAWFVYRQWFASKVTIYTINGLDKGGFGVRLVVKNDENRVIRLSSISVNSPRNAKLGLPKLGKVNPEKPWIEVPDMEPDWKTQLRIGLDVIPGETAYFDFLFSLRRSFNSPSIAVKISERRKIQINKRRLIAICASAVIISDI